MKSRLKRNNKMNKKANLYMNFDSIVLRSGDIIEFEAKIINNKPWFNINHQSPFNISSYYDGPDMERSLELYGELLLAFQGAAGSEKLRKLRPLVLNKIEKLNNEQVKSKYDDMYNSLKQKPLFLGVNDF